MYRVKLQKCFTGLFLCLWLIISFAALGAMYKLWWDREFQIYFGKDISEQRQQIWYTAGLPRPILDLTEKLDTTWPKGVSYTEKGDEVQLSYSRYILAPRTSSGSDQYWYSSDGSSGLDPSNIGISNSPPSSSVASFGPTGFVMSVLILFGFARLSQTLLHNYKFSFPEMCGCVTLLTMACVLFTRSFLSNHYVVVVGFMLFGFIAWGATLAIELRKGRGWDIFSYARKALKGNSTSFYFQGLLLVILIFSLLWSLLMSVIVVPDDWDAWAIWAVKAKVLALGHGDLGDVTCFGHSDYPLLWPSIWAFSGWLSGGWEEMWSRGWGTIFLLLCVWEMVVIVERITKRLDLGLLCGALFVSMPMVPLVASWSYAEAPFWLLTISCCGCLLLRNGKFNPAVTIVAALLATGAAYTKNEGVLFVLLSFFWILLLPGQKRFTSALIFLAVFGSLYFPWFYWTKIVLDLGSHATAGLQFDIENVTRAVSRVKPALETIFKIWSDLKQWNVVLWASIILTSLMLIKKDAIKLLFLPIGMLLSYFTIIVFHHAEIYWQVGTSWNRLTLQIMPILLVILTIQVWNVWLRNKE